VKLFAESLPHFTRRSPDAGKESRAIQKDETPGPWSPRRKAEKRRSGPAKPLQDPFRRGYGTSRRESPSIREGCSLNREKPDYDLRDS